MSAPFFRRDFSKPVIGEQGPTQSSARTIGTFDDIMDLNGKVAIVTGGTKGIGRAIAESLLSEGIDVCISARSGARLTRLLAR